MSVCQAFGTMALCADPFNLPVSGCVAFVCFDSCITRYNRSFTVIRLQIRQRQAVARCRATCSNFLRNSRKLECGRTCGGCTSRKRNGSERWVYDVFKFHENRRRGAPLTRNHQTFMHTLYVSYKTGNVPVPASKLRYICRERIFREESIYSANSDLKDTVNVKDDPTDHRPSSITIDVTKASKI